MFKRLFALFTALFLTTPVFAADLSDFAQGEAGNVLFIRHALAPGNGDPENFSLYDCATQRNLDAEGRDQAKALGDAIRAAGVKPTAVYSSQWCRCLETASLMNIGDVRPNEGLNSFYQGIVPREPTLAALQKTLDGITSTDFPVVMITHFVTISAITGRGPQSGGMVGYDTKTGKSWTVTP